MKAVPNKVPVRKISVILADDHPVVRDGLAAIVNQQPDMQVVAEASDGAEALDLYETHKPDVMVLDLRMPKMDGLQVLSIVRRKFPDLRVVVMTSDDAPATVLQTVKEQAFRYVHKPVEPATLIETIKETLEAPETPPIEVISARPEWVELVVPCTREAAERLQGVMTRLETDLAPETRDAIAYAFRELLLNAIEWGGRLDPTRTVRISSLPWSVTRVEPSSECHSPACIVPRSRKIGRAESSR